MKTFLSNNVNGHGATNDFVSVGGNNLIHVVVFEHDFDKIDEYTTAGIFLDVANAELLVKDLKKAIAAVKSNAKKGVV